MTEDSQPTLLGRKEGKGALGTEKKRVLPPPSCKNPSWGKKGGWEPGPERGKCCPSDAPDTLNPEQVVATALQAVWCEGWDQGPTVKAAGPVTAEADKSKTLPTAPEQLPGLHSHLPLSQGHPQPRIPKAPFPLPGLHHSPPS